MVVVVMGVSGSGKTEVGRRLAQRLGWMFADADAFHLPANVEKMSRKQPLTDADRRPWLEALSRQVREWLGRGENGVLACSALTEQSRRVIGVDGRNVRLVYLKGSFELIRERLVARKSHFMPPDLLRSQFDALEEPSDAITVDITAAPEAIVSQVAGLLH